MKNSGKILYFSQYGGEQSIPPEFIAAMERWETKQSVPNSVPPDELSDEIVESRVETDRTNERVKRTIGKKAGNIVLVEYRTTNNGQPVQITLTMYRTDSAAPAQPSATSSVLTKNLGNGWSIQEVGVEGQYVEDKFVPAIYQDVEFFREKRDPTPDRFQNLLPPVTQAQEIVEGVAAIPDLVAGQLKVSERQISLHKKIITQLLRAGLELPVTIIDKRTNDKDQIVTISQTYQNVGVAPLPTATQDVEVLDLGDGTEVVTTAIVPDVFPETEFTVEVNDNTPADFAATQVKTKTEEVVAGIAAIPTLGANDLLATEKQLTEFVKLVRTLNRSGLDLPITLISKDTNDKGQVVTVTRVLRVAGVDSTPTATQDVAVQALGDGNVVETKRSVDAVFAGMQLSTDRVEDLPDEFKALVDAETTEETVVGTAASPALLDDELEHVETQLTEFLKRVRSTLRTLTYPLTRVIYDMTDRFGGATTAITKSVGVGLARDEGLMVLRSMTRQLKSGKIHKETELAEGGAWSELHGTDVDPATGIATPYTEQVVAAGTTGGIAGAIQTIIKPLDKWRSHKTVRTVSTSALDEYSRKFQGFTDVDLPFELESLTSYEEESGGVGTFSESGAYTIAGEGNASMSLRGSSRASSASMLEVDPKVKEVWGRNIPCTHILFLVPTGTSRATIISKLTTLFGATVLDWPRFTPQPATLVCWGRRHSAEATTTVSASDGVNVDYTGAVQSYQASRSKGQGQSIEGSLEVKVVRIQACIHGVINIGGAGASASSAIYNAYSEILTLGGAYNAIQTAAAQSTSNITPVSLPTTVKGAAGGAPASLASIPTDGNYVAKLNGEPHSDAAYIRMHAVIVDAAHF